MKTKFVLIAAAVVMVTVISGNAFAWESCSASEKRDKRQSIKESIARELSLTAEQEKRLEDARVSGRKEMEDIKSAVKVKKDALRDALAKPGVVRKDIEPIAGEIKALEAAMADKRIDGIFKVKEILTPEQFTKLQAMKKDHAKDRKGKHERKGK